MKPWLVVEDEEDIRNIVKVMFGAWGHEAIEFRDGTETWKWLDKVEAGSHDGHLPELALLDIRMPGHKGNEIARRMRALGPFEQIPIVLMTAFSLTEDERNEMFNVCGVDHIINKPLPDFFELKNLLEDLRRKKNTATPSASDNNGNGESKAAASGDTNKPAGDTQSETPLAKSSSAQTPSNGAGSAGS